MKKILLTTAFIIAIAMASFAGSNKADKKLMSDLEAAVKNSSSVQWSATDNYKKAAFSFNNKTVAAFFSPDDNSLIGYSFHITPSELPAGTMETLTAKYQGWNITGSMLFIKADGSMENFVQVTKGSKNLALKVYANGKVSIFSHIPA